jgi:putative intracellular protease/amidase
MGDSFPVDVALNDAQPGDYSALLLPGGVMNPDYLSLERACGHIREILRRRQQAHRGDLPVWSPAANRMTYQLSIKKMIE